MNSRSILLYIALPLLLVGCDPIGYGYVNRLQRPVTVAHHVHGREERFTLAAGARQLPRMGDWLGEREEFFDPSGRRIAVFTRDDLGRLRSRDVPPVLIVSPSGASLAPREYWERWQEEAGREARELRARNLRRRMKPNQAMERTQHFVVIHSTCTILISKCWVAHLVSR